MIVQRSKRILNKAFTFPGIFFVHRNIFLLDTRLEVIMLHCTKRVLYAFVRN